MVATLMDSFGFDVLRAYVPEWGVRLASQLGLYIVLTLLSYFVIRGIRSHPPASADQSAYARGVRCCVLGYAPDGDVDDNVSEDGAKKLRPAKPTAAEGDGPSGGPQRSKLMHAVMLIYCSLGLLVSYLLWGIFQERIMSTQYPTGKFESSNFLVFSNRMFALMVAFPMMFLHKNPDKPHQQGLGNAPFFKYGLTSLSNTLSSWCQLEALKFVSFPMQVLAKSSKMVPVMIMGRILSGKRYPLYEYGIAVVIGLGVTTFMLSQSSSAGEGGPSTQISGVMLMLMYLMSDSFTSQWQDVLFKEYDLSSYQMMFGINAFSSIFTLASLLVTGELWSSFRFLGSNPEAIYHICAFSTFGAIGQTFIFKTIKEFGPLVFTIVSTIRQLLAIILSVVIFGHSVALQGMIGACVVFFAILYRVYRKEQESKDRKKAKPGNKVSDGAEAEAAAAAGAAGEEEELVKKAPIVELVPVAEASSALPQAKH